jgi:hypothetical protein
LKGRAAFKEYGTSITQYDEHGHEGFHACEVAVSTRASGFSPS